jgi:hypothetical protein
MRLVVPVWRSLCCLSLIGFPSPLLRGEVVRVEVQQRRLFADGVQFGAEGMLAGLEGSYLPLARTAAARREAGDPRPAVLERYPTRADYLARYLEAVLQLQAQRLLLPEDAMSLLRKAAARDPWDGELGK